MIYVYKYDISEHGYLIKQKDKLLKLGIGQKDKIISIMETLIGGYFSRERLIYQLKSLFSEKKWMEMARWRNS